MADPPTRINVTICGDGGCGKSSITLRLVKSVWVSEYDPTIEDSYTLTRVIDGNPYTLVLTDTAGQEEYRAQASHNSRAADAFMLVYDITNPGSLYDQLPYFIDMIRMEREVRQEKGETSPVVLVVGNKCDLKDERKISAKEGLDWARGMDCGFMETSAKERVGVEESFTLLVRRVIKARAADAALKAAYLKAARFPRSSSVHADISKRLSALALPPTTSAATVAAANGFPPTPPAIDGTSSPVARDRLHAASFSQTKPLTPVDEKENKAQAGDVKMRKEKWWSWLRCWQSVG